MASPAPGSRPFALTYAVSVLIAASDPAGVDPAAGTSADVAVNAATVSNARAFPLDRGHAESRTCVGESEMIFNHGQEELLR